jgi:hypothetical protein
VIGSVSFDGRPYADPPPKIMSRMPQITATITDDSTTGGVSYNTIRILIDGYVFTPEGSSYNVSTGLLDYRIPGELDLGTFVVTIEAWDQGGNIVTWEGTLTVKAGPTIDNVWIDGRAYLRGDIISSSPRIEARILDEAGTSETVDPASIRIIAGPHLLPAGADSYNFITAVMDYHMSSAESFLLGPGTYTFTIEAQDIYGNPGRWEGSGLKVMAGNVKLMGPVLSYPAPFKPLSGESLKIAYTLSVADDITIYMYGVTGQMMLTKKFRSGQEGGKAGYNQFTWNGRTDFGRVLGNGIYVYKLISNDKVIGTGKIVVHE